MTGGRFIRVRGGVLQAPVARYVHRQSGQVVTLITVVHVADARYYRAVRDLAGRLEAGGAVVQSELIDRAPEREWAAASDNERAALEACRRSQRHRLAMAGYLGWVSQLDALAPEPGWQNADMTDLEYIRAVGPEVLLAAAGKAEKLASLGEHGGRILGTSAAILWRLMAADRWQLITRAVRRGMDPVLERVTVAERSMRAVSRLPAGRDAVMIWGAGHLDTIDGGLRRRGFTRTGTRWVALGRLPAVRVAFRDLVAAVQLAERDLAGRAGGEP